MLAEKMLKLGQSGSAIRDIAAYADARREEIGSENVFDFSIGNPSTPAPDRDSSAIQSGKVATATTCSVVVSAAINGASPPRARAIT